MPLFGFDPEVSSHLIPCPLGTILKCLIFVPGPVLSCLSPSLFQLQGPRAVSSSISVMPRNKEVTLRCYSGATEENANKIARAVQNNDTKFVVRVRRCNNPLAAAVAEWNAIRLLLNQHATYIYIATKDGPSLYSFLVEPKWPNLRELRIESRSPIFDPKEVEAVQNASAALQEKAFIAPLPNLHVLEMAGHPSDQPPRWAHDMAPNVEYFKYDTRGYDKDPNWDMHRNNVIHTAFLGSEKYRTYTTPAFMRVYRKPGPVSINSQLRGLLLFESKLTHSPDYGVLVSEVRDKIRYERHLTFNEFEASGDLRTLELEPESSNKK